MGIDRSRRITFEEVADLYNEVRPGYPDELINDVIALSGVPAGGQILEIGCGPGNATLHFARRGYRILGIELGERLAALAAQNCRAYPQVRIICRAFEDWRVEEGVFDLVFAADALHWIPPELAYPKAARALKASGSAAFFWNVPVKSDAAWARAVAEVYRQHAPQFDNPEQSFSVDWLAGVICENFAQSGCFGPVTVRKYAWTETQTAEHYLAQLRTYSGHRGMDAGTRRCLFDGIRDVIERQGGVVEKPQAAVLFVARRR